MTKRDPNGELALDLPAAHRDVRIARNVVRHFARLEGVQDGEVEQLVLVVSELLANAIDHCGNGAAMSADEMTSDSRMRMSLVVGNGEWMLAVSDEGGGDPSRVRRALRSAQHPHLEDERGRGLFLIRQMVDTMEVDRSGDGRGLTIKVSRRHAGR
jgi:anti-sigma regulatory factor (Ser/Thr protein kinase)